MERSTSALGLILFIVGFVFIGLGAMLRLTAPPPHTEIEPTQQPTPTPSIVVPSYNDPFRVATFTPTPTEPPTETPTSEITPEIEE